MLENGNFKAGDEILIRFKLYADQLSVGWGWVIDNLKIQVDDVAPVISHISPDYLMVGDNKLTLLAKITDNTALDSVIFEVNIDGQTSLFGIDQPVDIYNFNLTINPVTATSVIKYRIIAVDSAQSPNTTYLPTTGFFEVPIADIGSIRTTYINDFNTATTDFVGSNFTIDQESGFNDAAIQSHHPYPNAVDGIVSMSYLLKYPIRLNMNSAWMSFEEIALVDPAGDRVVVEASKDNGATWLEITDPYHAVAYTDWATEFTNKDSEGNSIGVGTANLLKYRLINILSHPDLSGGDEVLIRFTMRVDDSTYAWGWTIDNLEIQGPTTGIEDSFSGNIQIYPNPSHDGRIRLAGNVKGNKSIVTVTDLLGKISVVKEFGVSQNKLQAELDLSKLQKGIYIIQVSTKQANYSSRVVIK
jgi:hypothetical protein